MSNIETQKDRLKEEFGDVVKYLREKQGLTQEELSHTTGLSVSAISKIEQGVYDIKLFSLLKLSAGLEIDPGRIVSALNDFNNNKIDKAVTVFQRARK